MDTIVMHVNRPSETQTFSCNGVKADRQRCKEEFETIMRSRQYFAFVETSPGKGTQVSTFKEIEELEKQFEQVTVQIQPALQGG